MTRDDIIRLAREAGAATGRHSPYQKNESIMPLCMDVERFAALVAAAEREACAKIAEFYEPICDRCPSGVATAIRAKGEQA
jgi:hypothetical protein